MLIILFNTWKCIEGKSLKFTCELIYRKKKINKPVHACLLKVEKKF